MYGRIVNASLTIVVLLASLPIAAPGAAQVPSREPANAPTDAPELEPETVLERVARTGVLTAGSQSDATPLSAIDDGGNWTGYSVEVLRLIHQNVEREVGREVMLQIVDMAGRNATQAVQTDRVDLVCSTVSITSSRQAFIDFSVGYFLTGTQFLVKRDNRSSGLLRVGVVPNTTNASVARARLPILRFVPVRGRRAGLEALRAGEIDALAGDGILLEGLRRSLSNPNDFEVFPNQPYSREEYGCVLPEGDFEFRRLVNETLYRLMEGVVTRTPPYSTLYDQWFGATGSVPIDEAPLQQFFQQRLQQLQTQIDSDNPPTPDLPPE
ncbi:MAG: amino acid ABC transporter substrate-binding protein [Kaiparowitsia implicata GSE-PSE-MK54-09C]|jgi:polar amino acid transport system substrate-binding protein|nr:amino acid ABC transporter substrate-binding protein [Kaiparowitsia implicata GSE-PSE-MK54-09C]